MNEYIIETDITYETIKPLITTVSDKKVSFNDTKIIYTYKYKKKKQSYMFNTITNNINNIFKSTNVFRT